jgi:hypothetical protein
MTLTEQHLTALDAFIQEMPTKYGVQLIKFFNEIAEEEKQQEILDKEEQEKPQEDVAKDAQEGIFQK